MSGAAAAPLLPRQYSEKELDVVKQISSNINQFRRLCGVGLVASSAVFIGVAVAQSGVPRAEVPVVKVGDRWKIEQSDRRTGIKESEFDRRVTAVTASQIEGTENNGKFVWTLELNILESSIATSSGEPKQFAFPLEVGKKWDYKFAYVSKVTARKFRDQLDANVVAYEKVKVAAGEFDAFKIEYKGYRNNDTSGGGVRLKMTTWYAPAARCAVKIEFDDGFENWVRQLVEFQLQP